MEKSKKALILNGHEYPFAVTMGALLRLKRETGREAGQLDLNDLEDMTLLLFYCVASASRRDGIAFDMSFDDFADALDLTDLSGWVEEHFQQNGGGSDTPAGSKKKSKA